jgi:hypothetical protein
MSAGLFAGLSKVLQTQPLIWPFACMWMLIAFRIVMGSMKVLP